MTHQEIFDTVVEGMKRQRMPSVKVSKWDPSFGPVCKYRAEDAAGNVLKCHIGMLIPDDMYKVGMESHFANSPILEPVYKHLGIDLDREAVFLMDLQKSHDLNANSADFMGDWKLDMSKLANDYALSTAKLATVVL